MKKCLRWPTRVCGGASSKETEKNIEDLLLNIIKALEKLPVDLDALKSCNAGKSVNNLRCHKNPEIHKRAKKLVDTWQKKVGAELDITESSSVQGSGWTCKPAASYDSSHLLKCGRGSVDGVVRFSGACTATVKVSGHNNSSSLGEVLTNPIPMSLGKNSSAMIKENSASQIQSRNNAPAEMFDGHQFLQSSMTAGGRDGQFGMFRLLETRVSRNLTRK